MDAKTENKIRQDQMESFGRLLAGFSHDMRNHLSVIREANGLLEDILTMDGKDADDPLMFQLKKTVALIERKVSQSAELYNHLSCLAHRSDTPLSFFHLNDLMMELVAFLDRHARLRQVSPQLKLGLDVRPICNDPALVQHVIYRLYMFCLELLEQGQRLVMSTAREREYAVIMFRLFGVSQVSLANVSNGFDTISAAISKLEGKIESRLEAAVDGVDSVGIRLLIPSLATDNT